MKAGIDSHGVLHVAPENETEAYALATWAATATVSIHAIDASGEVSINKSTMEVFSPKKIDVATNWPPHLGNWGW